MLFQGKLKILLKEKKKNRQVTHIAPLQPPALATFLSWGIQQELAV